MDNPKRRERPTLHRKQRQQSLPARFRPPLGGRARLRWQLRPLLVECARLGLPGQRVELRLRFGLWGHVLRQPELRSFCPSSAFLTPELILVPLQATGKDGQKARILSASLKSRFSWCTMVFAFLFLFSLVCDTQCTSKNGTSSSKWRNNDWVPSILTQYS